MNRIAFISDIHGNIDALDAVLQEIDRQGIDEIYCLGDIVGYGASPAECVQRVRDRCRGAVLGNHDELVLSGPENNALSERVAAGIRHAQKELSQADLKWLKKLPLSVSKSKFTIVHASLYNPECFNYLTNHVDARLHFENQKTVISFLGHTHVPMISEEGKGVHSLQEIKEGERFLNRLSRYAINVGSVGQPRDEDPRASFCIFDPIEYSMIIRRIPYDIGIAQLRIKKAKLPLVNAARLQIGS